MLLHAVHDLAEIVPLLVRAGARPESVLDQDCWLFEHHAASGSPALVVVRSAIRHAIDLRKRMRRWRIVGLAAGKLAAWHARAAERAYAPGGAGFRAASLDWEDRVGGKRRRGEDVGDGAARASRPRPAEV